MFYPDWKGILITATVIMALILLVPTVRQWTWATLILPVVADVLGRPIITVDGVHIEAAYPRAVEVAMVAFLILTLVTLRAILLAKQAKGSYWARRIRIDSAFVLSLAPFMALGPVVAALEAGLLFRAPWAFFAVPPLLYGMILVLALASLLFGLWIEEGGRAHGYARFLMALLVFLSTDLFWISVVEGSTRRLPLWAPPLALAAAFGIYFGVTLGNRLLSHRRVLFALGFFHVVFFGTYLAVWLLEGPWPAMDWTFRGIDAVRAIRPGDPWLALLVLLPPIGLMTGMATLGQFLHRYAFWARPWVDGLNLALVFGLVLEGWVTTILVVDPFGALDATMPPSDPIVAWGVSWLGGWGYFAWRTALAIAAGLLLDLPFRGRSGPLQEASHLARGGLLALGLIPGLRLTIRLATGL